ncbi:MAG: molybdopterin-guanine dinucleotide biosynthesis protein B [Lentisphaeria bacterium]|nr:molybdopterin-guanine dinucleotide biosynthesis protein B [Lentisphaeria bacterium]NQZ68582.1 molybdopterin-guanine dinucleotide biosynthesis protein B [Lentisphaeria bacterium]
MISIANPERIKPGGFQFNPLEIAICGHSNSGKTTLIEKLISSLSKTYRVAYVKHGHKFQMDTKGKDSYRMCEAGAKDIITCSEDTLIYQNPVPQNRYYTATHVLSNADFVIAEGWKNTRIHKLVVLDDEIDPDAFTNVLACVSVGERPAGLPDKFLHIDLNDCAGIEKLILSFYEQEISKRKLNGLILGGGKSVRMGSDKGELAYHGKSQIQWGIDLLNVFCETVYVSLRPDQDEKSFENASRQDDVFIGMGPMGGILTSLKSDSEAAWLVIACDLPYLEKESLEFLLKNRNAYKTATAYNSSSDGMPEPLCTVYEPKAIRPMLQFLGLGYQCPRKVLINSECELLEQANPRWLDNVNTMEEMQSARNELN